MECNSCDQNISLAKNLKRSDPLTEKNIDKCPHCGEEVESANKSDNLLEKNL